METVNPGDIENLTKHKEKTLLQKVSIEPILLEHQVSNTGAARERSNKGQR